MKIPKHIKDKMHKIAKQSYAIQKLSFEIQAWFKDNGFDMNELCCGNRISFKEIEYGNGIDDLFCEWIESGRFSKGED